MMGSTLPPSGPNPRPLWRAGALVLVCVLGGGFGVLGDSLAVRLAPVATPEEEEAKGVGPVQAAAVGRKGGLRPTVPAPVRLACGLTYAPRVGSLVGKAPVLRWPLTGAGIFQHC